MRYILIGGLEYERHDLVRASNDIDTLRAVGVAEMGVPGCDGCDWYEIYDVSTDPPLRIERKERPGHEEY